MTHLEDRTRGVGLRPEISVIVPFYNEEDNVVPLYEEIRDALDALRTPSEMIFVNDGSRDETLDKLNEVAAVDERVRVVDLLRNYGQTAAMMAGFDHVRSEIVVAMDGDGQNDPADISKLLKELNQGFDVVSGWRVDRKDRAFTRRLPSVIANRLISAISGVCLHDYGCSMKAYRRDVIKDVKLYGEMHRFIPIYAAWQGGRITEVPVNHRPRLRGISKYGLNRILKVLLDLMLVTFMERYLTKPIYVFGGAGIGILLLSFLCGVWAVALKIFEGTSFIQTPLPVIMGMFFSTGVVCILMGIMAELLMRTYYEAQSKSIYQVKLPREE
ncbi:MAG: glycosyltransferase family 2 protein [Pseudomonadota bacterium]